jgi:hypothetical protein
MKPAYHYSSNGGCFRFRPGNLAASSRRPEIIGSRIGAGKPGGSGTVTSQITASVRLRHDAKAATHIGLSDQIGANTIQLRSQLRHPQRSGDPNQPGLLLAMASQSILLQA